MKVLFAGDVVGSPGREVFAQVAKRFKDEGVVDAIVVNGENSAGGRGITAKIAEELIRNGADAITLGDHTWDQREVMPYLDTQPRIVRPANFDSSCPGKGITTIDVPGGRLTIMNLLGRVFMNPQNCPFKMADDLLRRHQDGRMILVDMHCEATSEKIAMGWHLDGGVSGVVGTHTHVQTSDERMLKQGTAYITDLGMTGSKDSVLGCEVTPVLKKFLTGLPNRFGVATENVVLEGVIIDIDETTGQSRSIQRVREALASEA